MTITAISGCSTSSESYTVDVVLGCSSDTLTIVEPSFLSPTATYNVRDVLSAVNWTDLMISSDNSLISCGAYVWEIWQSDGVTAVDPLVFTHGDYTLPTKTITV